METNPYKRKQPSAPSSKLFFSGNNSNCFHADEERGDHPSGFRVLIKVLPTRRVFSPTPNKIQNPGHGGGLPAETRKIRRNPCSSDVGSSKGSERVAEPDPVEDFGQTTPPEAVEMFHRSGHDPPRNADRVSPKQSNMSSITSHPENRSGRPLWVRGRLFKPPSSLSYRRLLPYLMDIAKEDESGIIRTCQRQKPEKSNEGKLLQQVSDSNCRDIPTDESSQDHSQTLAPSSAMEPPIASGLMKDLSLDGVTSAPANEVLGDTGTSCEDGNIIGNTSIHDQSPVKPDTRKCIHSGIEDCSDEGKVSEKAEKVIPVDFDQEVDDKASLRKQACSMSCDYGIDSQDSSKYTTSTAEQNAIRPVSEKARGLMNNSPNGSISKIKTSSPEDGIRSPTKSKTVLNPQSRSKLLKSPNTFSYRRLLPYLMEIEKDDQCTTRNTCPLKAVDSSQKHIQSATESSYGLKPPADVLNEHSPIALVSTLPCASSQIDGDGNDEFITKGSEGVSVASPENKKVINELHTEMNKGGRLLLEDTYQNGASAHIGIPCTNSQRGILKRNPRGCRGLCPCLNCTSFRLNAERAFEFSRNQVKDAEELALDLMKELSHLRDMLERINGSATTPDNLVLEACRKASEAEGIAKDRLREMNEDLNMHCRVKVSTSRDP
ncbi:hypothetical protein CRG98_009376 [Punica granatum]|uniref:Uncharacterized protein n=1 Tax=Punica granatum TaxID=22663 RepID=A0A2I0KP31_PUNGR|nr:hypothetical protein CRG98_009376 [Punica granatum]